MPSKTTAASVCLFGGAFDPPHRSHRRLAARVSRHLGVELFVIPSGDHPHKRADSMHASARHRLAMCRLAFEGLEGVRIDDRELRRAGPSYSIDTVRSFRAELGDGPTIHWLIGSDNVGGLPRWNRYHDLLREATLVTFPRCGHPVDEPTLARLDLTAAERASLLAHLLPFEPDARSATAVRDALADRSASTVFGLEELTVDVARYIAAHGLYRSSGGDPAR